MINAVKTVLYLALIMGVIFMLIPNTILVSESELPYEIEWFGLIGFVPITLGVIIYILCGMDFVSAGRGTPNPLDPPRNLVSSRLYGTVRNPFYVAAIIIVIGESILFTSLSLLVYAGLLWIACHFGVMLFEEPILRRKFGDSYKKYFDEVPRWIPKLSKLNIGPLKPSSDRNID